MGYNFRLNVIIRILIMSILLGTTIYLFLSLENYLRGGYFIGFWLISVIELIYYLEKTNRDFTTFLSSFYKTISPPHSRKKGAINQWRIITDL